MRRFDYLFVVVLATVLAVMLGNIAEYVIEVPFVFWFVYVGSLAFGLMLIHLVEVIVDALRGISEKLK